METSQAKRLAILALHAEGHSISAIAFRLGIHRNTAARWIRRQAETGCIDDMPRAGGPRCTTAVEDQVSM